MTPDQATHLVDLALGAGIATCAWLAGTWSATARRAWLTRERRSAILAEMRGEGGR